MSDRPFDPPKSAVTLASQSPPELNPEEGPPESESLTASESEKPRNLQVIDDREYETALQILELPDGEAKSLALTELVRRWGARDLEAALVFGESLGKHSEERRAFYRGIDSYLAEEDPNALLDVIGDGLWWQGQWKAERKAVLSVAETDFEKAVTHFSNAWEGKQHQEVAYRFANRLAEESSIEEALQFSSELKKPEAQGRAMQAALRNWANQDPVEAVSFIEGITDDDLRSYAVRGLVTSILSTNPTEALEWTMTISQPDVRAESIRQLARSWDNDANRAQFERLLSHASLSAAERSEILEGSR